MLLQPLLFCLRLVAVTNLALLTSGFFQSVYSNNSESEKAPLLTKMRQSRAENGLLGGVNNDNSVVIEGDKLEAIDGEKAIYSGNVTVSQGNRHMTAQEVTLDLKGDGTVIAEGNISFRDSDISSTSSRAVIKLGGSDQFTLEDTRYHLFCPSRRGEASSVSKIGKSMYRIEEGSITSCSEGKSGWRVTSSRIDIDQNKKRGILYNPRIEVLGIPIFYLPLLTVPMGDTRKTGILYPYIGSSSHEGIRGTLPLYWNIRPNYDLKTDIHYLSKRGVQLRSKFRYLTSLGSGNLSYEYLSGDKRNRIQSPRWATEYSHLGITNHWRIKVDYSKVSDTDYLKELPSTVGRKEDRQLLQEGKIQYRTQNWDLSLLTRRLQSLGNGGGPLYGSLPRLDFNYYAPSSFDCLNFSVTGHLTKLETRVGASSPDTARFHIQPSLAIPLKSSWGSWVNEAKLLLTQYEQDLRGIKNSPFKASVSRVIPKFRTNARFSFENSIPLLGYTQIIEPRFQYLYIPRRDQSRIESHDTVLLQRDYYALFRGEAYGGIDYIAPANQVSLGATTHFIDARGNERLNLSIGQVFCMGDTAPSQPESTEHKSFSHSSLLVIEPSFNFYDSLLYRGEVQYNVDTNSIQSTNSTVEIGKSEHHLIQTSYRYLSKNYLKSKFGDISLDHSIGDGISQIGIESQYVINKNWEIQGSYHYDTTVDRPVEWQAALRYVSDCWGVGLSYTKGTSFWKNGFQNDSKPVDAKNLVVRFGIVGFGTHSGVSTQSNIDSLDNLVNRIQ